MRLAIDPSNDRLPAKVELIAIVSQINPAFGKFGARGRQSRITGTLETRLDKISIVALTTDAFHNATWTPVPAWMWVNGGGSEVLDDRYTSYTTNGDEQGCEET
jgi:hypothetical protein